MSVIAERRVHLTPGDLICTGTPAGVASVVSGDTLHGCTKGLADLRITIG